MDGVPEDNTSLATLFNVQRQKVELDFSFCPRLVKGTTAIDVVPLTPHLKEIHLNCRQLKPTRITVENKPAAFSYQNLYERLQLYPTTGVQQYHFPQQRLRRHEEGAEEELVIFVPDKARIRETREEGVLAYTPLKVVIEYVLDDFRDAIHFAGIEDGDARYPHAYTRNSPFPGMASCLFPCVDDGSTRCNFDVAIRYPRTMGDALCKTARTSGQPQMNGVHKADSVMSEPDEDQNDLTEEEKALEMTVICSGMLTDDVSYCVTLMALLTVLDRGPHRSVTSDRELHHRRHHGHSSPAYWHCYRTVPARGPYRVPRHLRRRPVTRGGYQGACLLFTWKGGRGPQQRHDAGKDPRQFHRALPNL